MIHKLISYDIFHMGYIWVILYAKYEFLLAEIEIDVKFGFWMC